MRFVHMRSSMRFAHMTLALSIAVLLVLAPVAGAGATGRTGEVPPPEGTSESSDPVGTAAVMDIGVSARVMGMGGTFIGLADDATAVYYNPAGLALLDGREVYSLYSSQFGLASYMSMTYGQRNAGGGVLTLQSSGIETVDDFGNPLETVDYSSRCFMGAVAGTYRGLHLGGTVKYYTDSLPDAQGSGLTFDLGMLYDFGNFRVGAVGRNLLGTVSYSNGTTDAFDRRFGIGASTRLIQHLTLAFDAWSDEAAHVGAEYWLNNVALRGGARWTAEGTCLTGGLGVRLGQFEADYAYESHPVLPDNHRLSLGVRF